MNNSIPITVSFLLLEGFLSNYAILLVLVAVELVAELLQLLQLLAELLELVAELLDPLLEDELLYNHR